MSEISVIFLFFFFIFVFFFFQAEDGIRDAQESRGLGDVYKRQEIYIEESAIHATIESFERAMYDSDPMIAPSMIYAYAALKSGAVSYTHLTLPTIYSV